MAKEERGNPSRVVWKGIERSFPLRLRLGQSVRGSRRHVTGACQVPPRDGEEAEYKERQEADDECSEQLERGGQCERLWLGGACVAMAGVGCFIPWRRVANDGFAP